MSGEFEPKLISQSAYAFEGNFGTQVGVGSEQNNLGDAGLASSHEIGNEFYLVAAFLTALTVGGFVSMFATKRDVLPRKKEVNKSVGKSANNNQD